MKGRVGEDYRRCIFTSLKKCLNAYSIYDNHCIYSSCGSKLVSSETMSLDKTRNPDNCESKSE